MIPPHQWDRLASIYEAAKAMPPGQREALLRAQCGDDEALRREVDSLLAQDEREGPLDTPIWDTSMNSADERDRLTTGLMLGPYRIEALIGRGGMGEVYRARDTNLGREVALKVLPALHAYDEERLARFQREAQLLAALNHPNVATVLGLETRTPVRALVLELVKGETLAERIGRGPLPLDEALDIARQIADALQVAHDKGIVHRDLKPANVKITPDGAVKVLDFGLARLTESDGVPRVESSLSPTITTPAMTAAGVILGTAAYMSPEQAKGKPADKRSDIWAFGCLLYEMLTGKRPFTGEDVAETLAAVIRGEPDWSALPDAVPTPIVLVIQRCLEKSTNKRLSDIAAVRFVLNTPALNSRMTQTEASRSVGRWQRRAAVAGAMLVAIAVTAVAVLMLGKGRPGFPGPLSRFSIPLPEGQAFGNGGARVVGISPDGRLLAYTDRRQLYVRTMADGTTRPVAGTGPSDRSQPADAYLALPTFSPNSGGIAFASITRVDTAPNDWTGRATIARVRLDGSPPVTVADDLTLPLGMSWSDEGIVFGQFGRGVLRVSPDGGTPEVVVRVDEPETALNPQMLPGGRAIVFTIARDFNPATIGKSFALDGDPTRAARQVWDKARIVAQSLDTGARTVLVEGGVDGRYVPSGHLLYAVEGVLYAVPFDPKRLTLTGRATRVMDGIGRARLSAIDMGASQLSTSDAGTLVYLAGPSSAEAARARDLAVVAPGTVDRLKLPPMGYEQPRLSPDGKLVTYVSEDRRATNIWIYDMAGTGPPSQITFQGRNRFPVWSPDGRGISFQSDREGAPSIFRQPVDGSGGTERLTTADQDTAHIPYAWSPDGASLLFDVETRDGFSLWRYDARTKTSTPFGDVRSTIVNAAATFSSDGRWVAYQSGAPPSPRIFVQPFPPTGSFWTLPQTGRHPRWSADGSRLFFTSGPSVMAVDVVRAPVFRFLKPTNVLSQQAGMTFGPMYTNYDVLPDGRFLAPVAAEGIAPAPTTGVRQIEVVVNWFQDLTSRVPVR